MGCKATVTVKLHADGADTGKLASSKCSKSVEGRTHKRRHNDDGDRIEYTVKEADVRYTAKVTGTQEDGFTVTNTNSTIVTPGPKTPKSDWHQD